MKDRPRIIVGGFVGLLDAGGVTWDYIQYPLGFAALGCDVYYFEDTEGGHSAGANNAARAYGWALESA